MTLFDLPAAAPDVLRSAVLSADGVYRYRLGRTWDQTLPRATFVMLNPSTANAQVDDPTIRRCAGFARSWGLGGIVVVNLYALRSTNPKGLWDHADPVGPNNDEALIKAARAAEVTGAPLIAAWGVHAKDSRVEDVLALNLAFGRLQALGTTRDGAPRHPLYLRSDSARRMWP